MTTITKEWLQKTITSIESARDEIPFGLDEDQNNMLTALKIALASLEREQIRHEHAKWSDSTFGCVGPIGPLKHLSKEALEAAAEPDDLSEWADMQFLLWDAQRRAGISDAEINVAMEDKLKINMERQWPEPKDGEPRLHIKEPGNSPVTPDGWISCSERMFIVVRERLVLDAATRAAAGGESMTWPDAFAIVGVAMSIALIVFAICRWG